MRVVHKKDNVEGALYIGRGSKWGNPFKMEKEEDREEVIRLYRSHLWTSPDLVYSLPELRGVEALECFCAPKPCHGDMIIEAYNELVEYDGQVRFLIIAITGARRGVEEGLVREKMEPWFGKRNVFVLGGAMGVDNYALKFCQERGEEYAVVVPHRAIDQPRECQPYLGRALDEDRVCEMVFPDYPAPAAFHRRNGVMLRLAEQIAPPPPWLVHLTLAFPVDKSKRGGTWNCIMQAKDLGIPTRAFFMG